jgi:hypothetical protein
MNKKSFNTLFKILALLGMFPIVYHFIGVFCKINSSPVWRHQLFILIGAVSIYGILKRPPWFIWFFSLLAMQQLYSHGSDLFLYWKNVHRIHWISVAVLLFIPMTLFFLLLERTTINRE